MTKVLAQAQLRAAAPVRTDMRHVVVALMWAPVLLCARAEAKPPSLGPYGLEVEMWDEPEPLQSETTATKTDAIVSTVRTDHDWRPPDNLQGRWRLAAGVGLRIGTFLVDNIDTGTNVQGHVDLGVRRGRVWLAAEYALTSVTLPAETPTARALDPLRTGDVDGLVHRFGGFVRYAISRLGCRDAGFDVYLEGGAGVQHLRWDDGGAWTRPDVALGFGVGGWFAEDDGHGGITAGLRVTLAPRNDVDGAPATCAGPCDHATPPTGVDRSFLFDLTIPFGR